MSLDTYLPIDNWNDVKPYQPVKPHKQFRGPHAQRHRRSSYKNQNEKI